MLDPARLALAPAAVDWIAAGWAAVGWTAQKWAAVDLRVAGESVVIPAAEIRRAAGGIGELPPAAAPGAPEPAGFLAVPRLAARREAVRPAAALCRMTGAALHQTRGIPAGGVASVVVGSADRPAPAAAGAARSDLDGPDRGGPARDRAAAPCRSASRPARAVRPAEARCLVQELWRAAVIHQAAARAHAGWEWAGRMNPAAARARSAGLLSVTSALAPGWAGPVCRAQVLCRAGPAGLAETACRVATAHRAASRRMTTGRRGEVETTGSVERKLAGSAASFPCPARAGTVCPAAVEEGTCRDRSPVAETAAKTAGSAAAENRPACRRWRGGFPASAVRRSVCLHPPAAPGSARRVVIAAAESNPAPAASLAVVKSFRADRQGLASAHRRKADPASREASSDPAIAVHSRRVACQRTAVVLVEPAAPRASGQVPAPLRADVHGAGRATDAGFRLLARHRERLHPHHLAPPLRPLRACRRSPSLMPARMKPPRLPRLRRDVGVPPRCGPAPRVKAIRTARSGARPPRPLRRGRHARGDGQGPSPGRCASEAERAVRAAHPGAPAARGPIRRGPARRVPKRGRPGLAP